MEKCVKVWRSKSLICYETDAGKVYPFRRDDHPEFDYIAEEFEEDHNKIGFIALDDNDGSVEAYALKTYQEEIKVIWEAKGEQE